MRRLWSVLLLVAVLGWARGEDELMEDDEEIASGEPSFKVRVEVGLLSF